MKKGLSLILALLVGTTMLGGCGKTDAAVSNSNAGTSAGAGQKSAGDTKAQEGTSDEIFTWEGTTITGLTEKGKTTETLTIPDTATAIGSAAFRYAKMSHAVIGANVAEIGDSAFERCKNLEEISIPASVKKIGERAFSYCQYVTAITFSEGLTEIGERAFEATSAETITLPEGLTAIGEETFGPCPDTASIYLPASLENIPDDALFFNFGSTVYVKEGSWADLHYEEFVPDDYITKEPSYIKAYY